LHRNFPEVKCYLLDKLINFYSSNNFYLLRNDIEIFYVWTKSQQKISNNKIWIQLALSLVKMIKLPMEGFKVPRHYNVVFDMFGDEIFRQKFKVICKENFPDIAIDFSPSSQIKGLQTTDVIAGTIRRFISEENTDGYKIIEPFIKGSKKI